MIEEFITHDFKLPDHSNELSKANEIIEKLKNRITNLQTTKIIDDKTHVSLYEETMRVLDCLGRLSMPAFAVEDEMQLMYTLKFKHCPELGKKLWLDHYENVHHPYSLLKNRCFKLLDELDGLYREIYKKDPPNWKY